MRRTGRTSRMFFNLLGIESGVICVVFPNRQRAKYGLEQFCIIMNNLQLDYKVNKNNLIVTSYNRTYHFISILDSDNRRGLKEPNEIFFDQD